MNMKQFPVIDPIATGKNIIRLRIERGMSVRDLQAYFGFEEPQAIYKWQQGKSLPSVDNLYALGALFEVPMEDILVSRTSQLNLIICNQQVGGSNPSTSSILSQHSILNMGEFPSGQRGQTVNLLSMTSVVRIHLPPPKCLIFFEYQAFLQLFSDFCFCRKVVFCRHQPGRNFPINVYTILRNVPRENL